MLRFTKCNFLQIIKKNNTDFNTKNKIHIFAIKKYNNYPDALDTDDSSKLSALSKVAFFLCYSFESMFN